MPMSAKTTKSQLAKLKPLMGSLSLKTTRKGQDMIGELIERRFRKQVIIKEHDFGHFKGSWIIPRDERRQGVLLYLHGGGFTCGGLDYAEGVGAMLAMQSGCRVFCAAYRLAPENPFPAALDDAQTAYEYLISKGYTHITLCGESAGGGLCYSLCLQLKAQNKPLPCGIIAISPWTDLTSSGESYPLNEKLDPSMSIELLRFFADCYTEDKTNPLVSPLFADLEGMPPSLIYAAENEIMLSDATALHHKLTNCGCQSKLITKADRWHAYIVYGLKEDAHDFGYINKFLNAVMSCENKLRWMKLDNAAKIYPAARRNNWTNLFRMSATLKEEIDVPVLKKALDVTVRRFPSIAVKLRPGAFWYYLEQISAPPEIMAEKCYPLTYMGNAELSKCAFRVIAYQNRIAVEIFHSLTDGTGGLIFLKSLVAEYLLQKYGEHIPAEHGVLGRLEDPSAEELEDSFQKYSAPSAASRKENTAWHLSGTAEPGGKLHLTCFTADSATILQTAKEHNVTVTAFLTAVMMQALQTLQQEKIPTQRRRKPIKVLIPVNLRNLFPSKSLRNFALYTTPELLPHLGEYSFDEICTIIKHHMGSDITPKQMSMKIAANVNSERLFIVRIMPLFIKNIIMKMIFDAVGESKSCLCLSNLGAVKLPEEMLPYIERMDFILGPQASAPYNCGVLTLGDTTYINFIRNIKEASLESHFYRALRELGIDVEVQSNRTDDER
ncbi:MAG: alpha/beta hydrolase fold domain-containing protein [Clostridia bacterium]|nr:alpha/beta hydrolase fold domain-containing protein [Clostridia bacterium]